MVRAAAEGFGLRAIFSDFDWSIKVLIKSDASAALGMCKRQGLGKVRRLATADLWIQQRVRMQELAVRKWPGKDNPSDVLTKPTSGPDLRRHLEGVGLVPLAGRSAVAPQRAAALADHPLADRPAQGAYLHDEGDTDEEQFRRSAAAH